MDIKDLRHRCERRLRDLQLPVPFDVSIFCDRVAAKRGRPILLRPTASRAGPWGLWVATESADIIFFEADTSPLHQQHIILHELSHLVCAHTPLPVTDPEILQALLPDLIPETIRHVLSRVAYSAEEEREAELLASLVLERVAWGTAPSSVAGNPQTAGIRDRLGDLIPSDAGDRP